MNLDDLPVVLCNHRTRRTGGVDLIVIHTNEGPEQTNSAEGLASYLQRADPGYNVVVDVDSAIRVAYDNETVWGAGGVNSRAWHLCLLGYSNQSSADWGDPYSRAELVNAAQLVRQAAIRFGVPMQRVTDTRPSAPRGICGHVDVSRYHPESQGHTDPGVGFPWDAFMAMVTNGAAIPPSVPVVDQEVVAVYAEFKGQTHRFFKNTDTGQVGHVWPGGFENMTEVHKLTPMAAGGGQIAVHVTPLGVLSVGGVMAGQKYLEYRYEGIRWGQESWPK